MGILQQVFYRLDAFPVIRATALKDRVKGKGQLTCYTAASVSHIRAQKCFTVSAVAADWCELVIL